MSASPAAVGSPAAQPLLHAPSAATRSHRRRAQKASERASRRAAGCQKQRGLDLAQKLLFFADTHPEFSAEINRLVQLVRVRSARTSDRDAEAVLDAIVERHCRCADEIADETHLPQRDVDKILSGLVATGQLRELHLGGGRDTQFVPVAGAHTRDVRP